MKYLFLLFAANLFADYNPLVEFPALYEMKVGLVKKELPLDSYDLIIAEEPLQQVNSLEKLIHWSANGYVKCAPETLNPLLQILMKYGKQGFTSFDDVGCPIVIWKAYLDPLQRLKSLDLVPGRQEDDYLLDIEKGSLPPHLHVGASFPKDQITVALYIARSNDLSIHDPLAYPPDSFYIEELKRIQELFKNKDLYVTVFTEGVSLRAILQKYDRLLRRPNITLVANEETGFISTLQAISKHDCFIHPQSHYTLLASLLKRYQLEVSPLHYHEDFGFVTIDAVSLYFSP
jgi:hypothetical protein